MANKPIKQRVEIDFFQKGLAKIQETLKLSLDPKKAEALKIKVDALSKYINEKQKNWTKEIAVYTADQFEKISKSFKTLQIKIPELATKEESEKIKKITESINLLNIKQLELQEIRKKVNRSLIEEGDKTVTTKSFATTSFNKTKEEKGVSFLGLRGKEVGFESYIATQEKISAAMSGTEDIKKEWEAIQNLVTQNGNVWTEESKEKLSRLLEQNKISIDQQVIENNTLAEKIRQNELSKAVEEEKNKRKKANIEITKIENELTEKQNELNSINNNIAERDPSGKVADDIKELSGAKTDLESISLKVNEVIGGYEEELKKSNSTEKKVRESHEKTTSTFGKAAKQVFNYGLAYNALRKIYRETIKTITELDAALTEMAIVTTMNRKETWELLGTFQSLAKETGFTTTEIAKLSTIYFRQGRQLKDVIELTEAAAKAARVAGISAEESANYLTSAINGFGLAADKATEVSDKFAALAASSASSYEELAIGLSKFAAQANVAGLSMDFALGMLAKGVETTREAPESIGTAIKTVLARMREITDYGKTLEDGMDVSRVEGSLKSIGIQLRDTSGQFRDMESVLKEVGNKWDTLNKNQQASVAVALAGTRQQSRLLAIFQNFDRTLELVNESQESSGATNAQQLEYMNSMQAAMTRLATAWQEFITTITDSELIIGIVKTITWGVETLSKILNKLGIAGKNAMIAIGLLVVALKAKVIIEKISLILGLATSTGLRVRAVAYLKEAAAIATGNASLIKYNLANKSLISWLGLKIISIIKSAAAFFAEARGVDAVTGSTLVGTKAWIGYWIAATAGIALLIVGLVAVVKWISTSIKKQKEQNISLDEAKKKYSALNYELNKTNKSMQELIDKYNEINSKSIQTEEDIQALKDLEEQIKSLETEDKKYTAYKASGEIDFKRTIENMQYAIDENLKEIKENVTKEFSAAITEGFEKGFNDSSKIEIADYLSQYIGKDLTEIQSEGVKKYLENIIGNNRGQLEIIEDLIKKEDFENAYKEINKLFSENNIDSIIEKLSSLEENVNLKSTLSDKTEEYKKLFSTLDEESKKVFKSMYPFLDYLSDFDSSLSEFFDVGDIDFKNFEEIDKILTKEGRSTALTMDRISELYSEYSKSMSKTEAYNKVIQELANSFEDTSNKISLYNIIIKSTTLETSQQIDKANNSIKNLKETQEKFLKGELSQEDKYNFMENFADYWDDANFIKDFKKGNDLTKYLVKDLVDQYDNYTQQITYLKQQLLDPDYTREQRENFLVELNRLEMLSNYIGKFEYLTQEQENYNKELDNYNKLKEFGISNQELENSLLENSRSVLIQNLSNLSEQVEQEKKSWEGGLSEFNKIYEKTSDGIYKVNIKLYNELDETQQIYFDNILKNIEELNTKMFEEITNWNKLEIEIEENKIEKIIGIYEDYYDSLNRLEDKEEKERSKQDVINQLQRLEGATDERSRQKAKELRKELNKINEDSAKEERETVRKDHLDRLKEEKDMVKEVYGQASNSLYQALANGGIEAAKTLAETFVHSGLMSQETYDQIFSSNEERNDNEVETTDTLPRLRNSRWLNTNRFIGTDYDLGPEAAAKAEMNKEQEELAKFNTFKDWLNLILEDSNMTKIISSEELKNRFNKLSSEQKDEITNMIKENPYQRENIYEKLNNYEFYTNRIMKGIEGKEPSYDERYFKKGGLVDYTGRAIVHGTPSSPEAFLNAEQTSLFANLRDILSKSITGSGNISSSINIEQITIQTDKLNNSQDFNKAGKILAEAFNSAIKSRGLNINTKR